MTPKQFLIIWALIAAAWWVAWLVHPSESVLLIAVAVSVPATLWALVAVNGRWRPDA